MRSSEERLHVVRRKRWTGEGGMGWTPLIEVLGVHKAASLSGREPDGILA